MDATVAHQTPVFLCYLQTCKPICIELCEICVDSKKDWMRTASHVTEVDETRTQQRHEAWLFGQENRICVVEHPPFYPF